jgi:hypothetical protein
MQVIRATVKTETASNLFKDGRNTVFGVYLFHGAKRSQRVPFAYAQPKIISPLHSKAKEFVMSVENIVLGEGLNPSFNSCSWKIEVSLGARYSGWSGLYTAFGL